MSRQIFIVAIPLVVLILAAAWDAITPAYFRWKARREFDRSSRQ